MSLQKGNNKGWEKVTLGDCVSLMKSGLSRKLSTTDIGMPMLRSNNIGSKHCIFDDIKYWYVNDPQGANTKNYVLDDGDLLVNFINSIAQIGKACIFKNEINRACLYTTNILRIKPNSKIDSDFLYFITQTFEYSLFVKNITKPAVNQASFTTADFKEYSFPLPTLPEQTAIASLLSTWDLAIEKTERLIAAKETQYTSLVKMKIADKCDSWAHLRADKIFKSISEKQNSDEELLSVTQDRGVIPRSMLEGRVMSPESGTDTYKLIKIGDFAISLRSFQGGIEYSRYQGLISPAYTVLRPKLEIDDDFYRHFFKSYLFIEKYLSIAVIGIRDGKQISIPDFMTVKIPLPPIEEQKQIAAILTTARQEIDLLKQQAEAYRRQKRGLMQRLLTGEWRVRMG